MMTVTLAQIAKATGGQLVGCDREINFISSDTRTLPPGCLFVALVGDNFDGNDYAQQALDKGAAAVLVSDPKTLSASTSASHILVADTTQALGQLASWYRQRWGKQLVAITGSCGKTTVKGMVAAILTQVAPTWATLGNLNNHIGVPKTLLALEPKHHYAVVEMGASGPGEIGYLAHMAQPQVALVNNVVPAHLEGFGSEQVIAETKGAIYQGLDAQGTAVINLDDKYAGFWLNNIDQRNWLGFSSENSDAHVHAKAIKLDEHGCAGFMLCTRGAKTPVQLNVLGSVNVTNALAAASCALALEIPLEAIKQGLESFVAVAGRLAVAPARGGARLIDDSYNANPGSVKAAIDVLAAMAGSTILVLGDMGELGEQAEAAHREIGRYAKSAGIDALLSVGPLSQCASDEFTQVENDDSGHNYATQADLIAALQPHLNNGATILIKGSRSAGMDQVVRAIAVNGETK